MYECAGSLIELFNHIELMAKQRCGNEESLCMRVTSHLSHLIEKPHSTNNKLNAVKNTFLLHKIDFSFT